MRCIRVLILSLAVVSILAAGPIPDALTPYQMIDISSGHGVGSGAVSTGHVVFGFNATSGQVLDISVIVTGILQGTRYTDDDSMLWIFDSNGVLLAQNDDYDPSGYQSRIPNFQAPATGLYLAGVTTCCTSDPIYSGGVLTGWEDAGGSNIEFNLDITTTPASVPEPSTFALLALGGIALCLARRSCA